MKRACKGIPAEAPEANCRSKTTVMMRKLQEIITPREKFLKTGMGDPGAPNKEPVAQCLVFWGPHMKTPSYCKSCPTPLYPPLLYRIPHT